MNYKIKNIHLSIEKIGLPAIDYASDSTDVIVELIQGDVYVASFFTYKYLEIIRQKNKKEGEFLNGKYFWAEGMVIVEDCSLRTIKRIVRHLMDEGDFEKVFEKL